MLKRASVATEIAVCISLTVLVLFAAMAIYSDSIANLIDSSKFGKSIVKPTTTMSKEDVMRSEIEFIKTAAAQGRQALKDEALAYINDILEGRDLHGVDSTDPEERALAERALAKELTKLALVCGHLRAEECPGTDQGELPNSVNAYVSYFNGELGTSIALRNEQTIVSGRNVVEWASIDSCKKIEACGYEPDPTMENDMILRISKSLTVFDR